MVIGVPQYNLEEEEEHQATNKTNVTTPAAPWITYHMDVATPAAPWDYLPYG